MYDLFRQSFLNTIRSMFGSLAIRRLFPSQSLCLFVRRSACLSLSLFVFLLLFRVVYVVILCL